MTDRPRPGRSPRAVMSGVSALGEKRTLGRARPGNCPDVASNLNDDLFALGNGRLEFIKSLTSHAAQVELKHGEQLAGRVVKLLSYPHAFISTNGDVRIRHRSG